MLVQEGKWERVIARAAEVSVCPERKRLLMAGQLCTEVIDAHAVRVGLLRQMLASVCLDFVDEGCVWEGNVFDFQRERLRGTGS